MEGGDLLGAYERACEMAELKASLAGVQNPISAMHAQRLQQKGIVFDASAGPRAGRAIRQNLIQGK